MQHQPVQKGKDREASAESKPRGMRGNCLHENRETRDQRPPL